MVSDGTDEMIAAVWQRVRPSAAEKIATLRTAFEILRAGGGREDLDEAAAVNAHRLAGSLGTYGFVEAAAAAVIAERCLAGAGEIDLESLENAVTIMERTVRGS